MGEIRKVLLASAKAGSGHIRASEAVVEAFQIHHPGVEARHVELLEHTNWLFRNVYAGGYHRLAGDYPLLWRMTYERSDAWTPRSFPKRMSEFLNRLNAGPFMNLIRREAPDAVAVTHFLAGELLARMRRKGDLKCKLHVIVTDFDIHSMWVQEGVDQYLVASDEIAAVLHMKGVPPERVRVTGIPIVAAFSREYPDKPAMRRQLGLRPEPPTVLLSAGGFGLSRLDQTVALLAEAVADVQIIAIAGRNEKLKRDLDSVAASHPGRIVPTGFVANMHELMAASDFAVTKSGGLTVSECLAMSLPMIVINPVPGQEERNADYLLENGAALRANVPGQLVYKFKRMLEDPDLLARMRASCRRIARPNAARDIAAQILEV